MRRVALVTGGARRVGEAIVRSFARSGFDVALHYGSSESEAQRVASELQETGARVHLIHADLRQPDAPDHVIASAIEAFGRLDVVVSSASHMKRGSLADITPADWDEVHDVNVRAPFFLSRAAARVMTDGGAIIHLADHLANETGFPTLLAHQISKAAIPQLVRVLAAELAPRIRVNAVAPGLVLAPEDLDEHALHRCIANIPLRRSGNPADVTQAIHYLVNAPYVTGTVLEVDGGRHLRR